MHYKMDVVDDEEEVCPVEETIVRRKRRKKKQIEEVFLPLPDEVVSGCKAELLEELNIAYQILQAIMRVPKIEPFIEKPNENLFHMSTYYKIIKNPMWLLEVQRKLFSLEYDGIGNLVADMRLILENCYRFWGTSHKFSRRALYVEHHLEQRLANIPKCYQDKCLDPELHASEVVVKTESTEDEYIDQIPEQKESFPLLKIKGFESKILNKVLESEETDNELNDDLEEQAKTEATMLQWEKDHLVDDFQKEKINITWQLAEIGSFLKLTWEAFNVEEITQFEVERMLLMPKESTTLANLMTSMLSYQIHRAQLDVKPVMPYEIWTSRLKKRLDSWFNIYYSTGDVIETFTTCGIEPHFWAFIGPVNPMEHKKFHELCFFKRVWILKSLCNNLMHIDKPIQDIIIDSAVTKDMKPVKICIDKKGVSYFKIPFFREIRIYKQTRLPNTVLQEASDVDSAISNILDSASLSSFNENDNEMEFSPSNEDCILIADSIESLTSYIADCKKKKKLFLARNLSKQLRILKKERRTTDGLTAIYNQWHDYHKRSDEYFTNMLNLWYAYEKPPKLSTTMYDEAPEEEVLGKRRKKTSFNFASLARSTDSEEPSDGIDSSDVSDWENENMKTNKKKVDVKKRSKQSISDSRSESSDVSKQDDNFITIQEVTIKEEVVEDVKPEISQFQANSSDFDTSVDIKPEIVPFRLEPMVSGAIYNSVNLENTSVSNVLPMVHPGNTSIPVNPKNTAININKEKSDVIYISSDEENETTKKSSNLTKVPLNSVNNGMPQKVSSRSLPLPAKTPSPQQPPTFTRTRNVSVPTNVPQAIFVPQSGPTPQMISTQPRLISPHRVVVNSSPAKAPVPRPIPIPAPPTRKMPLPIPEPAMPQPMLEPSMPVPMGAPRAWGSPQTTASSPISRGGYSPRLRSPVSHVRTPSPRASALSPIGTNSARSPRGASNLVSPMRPNNSMSPVRPVKAPVRNLFPQVPAVPSVEGVLEIGQKPDGSYGYHVRLPDGGVINMSRKEIDDIRRKNNGVLPVKIEVPLSKNKNF